MIRYSNQRGEAFMLVIVVLAVVLLSVVLLLGGSRLYFQNANYSIEVEKATGLAEAGVDKAIVALNASAGSYNGSAEVALGDGSFSVTIVPVDAATKRIEATGYYPNKTNPKVKRVVKIQASRGVGTSFIYGIQVGEGGMALGNSNIVNGSIYSNGSITAGNSNQVDGDIWVAGGPQPNPDQSTPDCDGANCSDYLFGKAVNGEERLAVAQSLKPGSSGVLNKVSMKIKKFGNPPNMIVRVMQDSGGKPDKNAVLTTGTLYASLVGTNYGWIDITFDTSPAVTQDTIYWLMFEAPSDANNYWSWQNDLAQGYTRGLPKWSQNWSVGNPTWNSITGDLSFKSFLGGAPTSIRANSNKMTVSGEAHANTIENLTIAKDVYYQTIITSTVGGISHPGSADPPPKVFPISDANVADWKNQAGGCDNSGNNCQTISVGDITTCPSTLGPRKIVGNVTFGSGCKVKVKSPIWITGNLTMDSNNILTLDSSYGSTSGVIVVGSNGTTGKITLNSNNHLNGTGVGSSLLMALSTYDSRSNDISSVQVNSNGNTGVYYASKGIIEPGTSNTFKELTAWKIRLVNNSTIDYEQGLSSTLFTSGPSGSYSLVKGTYQVK